MLPHDVICCQQSPQTTQTRTQCAPRHPDTPAEQPYHTRVQAHRSFNIRTCFSDATWRCNKAIYRILSMHTVVKRTRLHPQHRISKQHLGDVTDISADAYCSQERPTTPATSHLTATPKRSQQHNFKTTAPSRAESTCPDDCGMPIALPQRSKEKECKGNIEDQSISAGIQRQASSTLSRLTF